MTAWRVLAAASEVPIGCANAVQGIDAEEAAMLVTRSMDLQMTAGARALLSESLYGGRTPVLRGQVDRGADPRFVIASAVAAGQLVVLERRIIHPFGAAAPGKVQQAEPRLAPTSEPGTVTAWIKFKVVDDRTGVPIPGVNLRVTLTGGRIQEYVTRSDGLVEIFDIQPGACEVTSNIENARLPETLDFVSLGEAPASAPASPAAGAGAPQTSAPGGAAATLPSGSSIADIEAHKVQTGESIDSLARGAGMTWQQLALFNWGTAVPEQINEHLRDDVGCTRRTADGHNYMFDSSDDPGIVHIPRVWRAAGLATDQTHVIRVSQPAIGLPLWIRLAIDPTEAQHAEDRFVLSSSDGSIQIEKTVKDDHVPGDRYVDLCYSGLKPELAYTMEIHHGEGGAPIKLFENVPHAQLPGLSGNAPDEPDTIDSPEPDAPYPDEPEEAEDCGASECQLPGEPATPGDGGDQQREQYQQSGGYQQSGRAGQG